MNVDKWGSGRIASPFFNWALDGGEWSASHPGRSTSGEIAPGTHEIGGWEGPRSGLDVARNGTLAVQPIA
jgi:hypothetical protein